MRFGSTSATSSKARLRINFQNDKDRELIKTRENYKRKVYERQGTLEKEKDHQFGGGAPTNQSKDELIMKDWKDEFRNSNEQKFSKERNFDELRVSTTSKQQRTINPPTKVVANRKIYEAKEVENIPNQQ